MMPEAGQLGLEAAAELMGLGAPAQLPCSPHGDLRTSIPAQPPSQMGLKQTDKD